MKIYEQKIKQTGEAVDRDNFYIITIDMKKHRCGSWTSEMMPQVLKKVNPDIIYYIGLHNHEALMQVLDIRKKCLPDAKVIAFSMRGKYHAVRFIKAGKNPAANLKRGIYYLYSRKKLKKVNKYCDAMFCHYPDGINEFIREGFEKPIYMQTQVGVDPDYFHPDAVARQKIREKYAIGDASNKSVEQYGAVHVDISDCFSKAKEFEKLKNHYKTKFIEGGAYGRICDMTLLEQFALSVNAFDTNTVCDGEVFDNSINRSEGFVKKGKYKKL